MQWSLAHQSSDTANRDVDLGANESFFTPAKQRLLLAQSGHCPDAEGCPLVGAKRTSDRLPDDVCC